MIPRFKPTLGWSELSSAFRFPRKKDVQDFEHLFAKKMNQKYAVAVPYGRTGLILLLKALGLEQKEIICPAYTCVVVAHAIVESKNKPVFIDSEPEDGNMDLDQASLAVSENTGALIATSIFGYPCNLEKLQAFRQKHPNIPIIQDCAHSFSAEWKGEEVQKEGIAAFFGLNASKTMMSVFGGMITTDDSAFYEKLIAVRGQYLEPGSGTKSLRRLSYLLALYPTFWNPFYSLVSWLENTGVISYFTQYYDEAKIEMPNDFRQRMVGVEARVGQTQLKRFDAMVTSRRAYAQFYHEHLKDLAGLKLFPLIEGATYSQMVATVESRDEVIKACASKGIQLGHVLEYTIPYMRAYRTDATQGKFPVSERFAKSVINLPIAGQFKKYEAERTVEVLREVIK